MAIDLNNVHGCYEIVAEVENLVTLRTEVAVRVVVQSDDERCVYHDGISIIEVKE